MSGEGVFIDPCSFDIQQTRKLVFVRKGPEMIKVADGHGMKVNWDLTNLRNVFQLCAAT